MTDSASESSKASRAADVVSLFIGVFVATLVGHTVLVEQRAVLEQCAPSCDLRGLVVAQADVILSWPFALAKFTLGPWPVGAVALLILVGFILIYLVDPPVV